MVFEMNGSYVEIQVNMDTMLKIKNGEGHAIYEEIRAIQGKASAEKRPMTKSETNQVSKLSDRSMQLYSSAWDAMTKS